MAKVSISLAEFDELRGIKEKFEKRVEEARGKIREELLRETSRLAEANGRLMSENASLREDVRELAEDRGESELDVLAAEKKVKELEKTVEDLRAERDRFRNNADRLVEIADELRSKLAERSLHISGLERTVNELRLDKATLRERNEELGALRRKYLKENTLLFDRLAALRRRGLWARVFRKGERQ